MSERNAIPPLILQKSRAFIHARFDRVGEVVVYGQTPDDSGGYTEAVVSSVPVLFQLSPGNASNEQLQQRLLDRIGNNQFYFLITEHDFPIGDDAEIHQTSPDDRWFRVLGNVNQGTSYQAVQRLVVVEK